MADIREDHDLVDINGEGFMHTKRKAINTVELSNIDSVIVTQLSTLYTFSTFNPIIPRSQGVGAC